MDRVCEFMRLKQTTHDCTNSTTVASEHCLLLASHEDAADSGTQTDVNKNRNLQNLQNFEVRNLNFSSEFFSKTESSEI